MFGIKGEKYAKMEETEFLSQEWLVSFCVNFKSSFPFSPELDDLDFAEARCARWSELLDVAHGDFHLKPHCITRWCVVIGDWWWLMGGLGSISYFPGSLTAHPWKRVVGRRILSYWGLKVAFQGQTLKLGGGTLPESNKKSLKIGHAKGISSTQNHWFSGDMLVLGRVLHCFFGSWYTVSFGNAWDDCWLFQEVPPLEYAED